MILVTAVSVAALPPGPATLAAVKDLLRITATDDDTLIQAAVDAVNVYVVDLPSSVPIVDGDGTPTGWPANTIHGANMLAGRIYRRRNSPAGVESFSDLGGAVYVQRNDPDVALLLGTGAYTKPRVG